MATKMEIHVAYVEELNKVAGFDPQIPTDFDSIKELKKRVKKEMAKYGGQLFIFDEEKLSEELWEFLTDDLDIEPRPKKEWASFVAALEKEAEKRANEDDGDDDEDGDDPPDDGEETETETKSKKGKEKDMATDKGKNKTEKKEKEKGKTTSKKKDAPKGPGVIASIRELVTGAKKKDPITKKAILKELMKRFPDKDEKSMMSTINVQIPGRVTRETNFTIHKTDDGAFYATSKKE